MYVTITHKCVLEIDGADYELFRFQQYPLIGEKYTYYPVESGGAIYINHYIIKILDQEVLIPETLARLEKELRPEEKSRPDYLYDKLTGKFDQPKDWITDYIKRTGNDIRKFLKPHYNGENINLPGKEGPVPEDTNEQPVHKNRVFTAK